jgi:hypothetical protein
MLMVERTRIRIFGAADCRDLRPLDARRRRTGDSTAEELTRFPREAPGRGPTTDDRAD